MVQQSPPQVYIILHLSSTCEDYGVSMAKDQAEILEVSWSIIKNASSTVDFEETEAKTCTIKPANTPITQLCTSLTGLSWDDVREYGSTFHEALTLLDNDIKEKVITKGIPFAFVLLSSWNLKVQLPREARDKAFLLPQYLQYPRLFELKLEYEKWQRLHPESSSVGSGNVINMCTALGIDINKFSSQHINSGYFVPKRGIDHVKIICEIVRKIEKNGYKDVFQKPYDMDFDIKSFLAEKSRVLYLSNLPSDTTQAELESWFTRYGARPTGFRTLQSPEPNKHLGTGFAVFATHTSAVEALAMNGRALNDRVVEIQPSSFKVLEFAQEILIPFPQSKNKPRPGDWTCPSCGFSNFQRRTACLRCSFPTTNGGINENVQLKPRISSMNASGNGIKGPGTGNSIPFRAGDWKCENCYYHNFAKNLYCLRCGITRVSNNNSNAKMISAASSMILPGMNQFSSTMLNGIAGGGFNKPVNMSNQNPMPLLKGNSTGNSSVGLTQNVTGSSFGSYQHSMNEGMGSDEYLSWSMGQLSVNGDVR